MQGGRGSGRGWEAAAVLLLAGALLGQLGHGASQDGLTNDELLYVPAGYRSLVARDFTLETTHPPLAKMVAAAGLLGSTVTLPEPRRGESGLAWCFRFFHETNDAGALLSRARRGPMVVTVLVALLAWWWARVVAGPAAGLLTLAFASFHPSLLAHGHLATTDAPSTLTFLVTSWAFWRWSRAPSPGRGLLVGLALGVAVGTRLTGVLLFPALALAAFCDPTCRRVPARAWAVLVALTAAVVPLVLWASFGFGFGSEGTSVPARGTGAAGFGWLLDFLEAQRLLPQGFVEGVRFQLNHSREGHLSFLLGERRKTGFGPYFAIAFLVKNTPGFLLALAAAGTPSAKNDGQAAGRAGAHWWAPTLVLFVTVSLGGIHIGERYLLPAYPYLALCAGVALARLSSRPWGKAATALALGLHLAPTAALWPHGYLPYFNALAGGRTGGHRVLLDSNLDWGQDLPRLGAWMRTHGVDRVQLAYWGADSPERFGIVHDDLPGGQLYTARPPREPFHGVIVVSPNLLYGLVPRLGDPYAFLRERTPDDRAGVFFVYRLP